ncbi:MAG TPA: ATP-binding protein [Candidatus Eisenbacteria bacterium]|nr:ATP-binding protein [Candidatus Eisenbacteria bacterium]
MSGPDTQASYSNLPSGTRGYLPVTVDKSHLVTIGERLYTESIELIRELVNNAYDADATEVKLTVSPESVSVEDNGTGMDMEGLRQYFVIGSQEKLLRPKSPIFKRDRIGQFGIGKFATLSACKRFIVYTQKDDFAAQVIFDKDEWSRAAGEWQLPLELLPPDQGRGNGTTVTLHGLNKQFAPEDVERKIMEGVPLKAPHFAVFLNGRQVRPKSFSGHRIPFLEGTEFGPVSGEIVILPASAASVENLGIEVKVKQVTVRRQLFGAETWGKVAARIRGEVHADFLPVTSDRSGFVIDSPEYQVFAQTMQRIMTEVQSVLHRLTGKGEKRAASRALGEALGRITKALMKNPEFSPFGPVPIGEPGGIGGAAGTTSPGGARTEGKPVEMSPLNRTSRKLDRKKRPTVKRLTPDAVVRRLKMGQAGISCCLDHFGETGPESFSEGTIVYINRDHPLYKREAKKAESHTMHIARLLSQEIALMKDPRNPRQAFERQSKLLRDAFIED